MLQQMARARLSSLQPRTPTGVGFTSPPVTGPQMPSPRHRQILFTGHSPGSRQPLYRATIRGVPVQEMSRSSAPRQAIQDLTASGATSSRDRIAEVEEELRRLRREVEGEQSATGGGPSGSGARAGDAPVVQPEVMDISQVADGAGRQGGRDASSNFD